MTVSIRISKETRLTLSQKAYKLGYIYGNKGSVKYLLEAIANNEVTLIKKISV